MMGRLEREQEQLFYSFRLDEAGPDDHPVRGIAAVLDLSWVHAELAPYYPKIGRPSIDPVLMIRMLVVGYAFAIRSERLLCREVQVNLAYRWCGLSLGPTKETARRGLRQFWPHPCCAGPLPDGVPRQAGRWEQWPPELASFANTGREVLALNQFLGPPKPPRLVGLERSGSANRSAVRPDADDTRRTP
jgi:hypothetical protein